MKKNDCILVSINFSDDVDSAILIVGRKSPGKDVEIINVINGVDAYNTYKKLVTSEKNRPFNERR